MLQIYCHLPRKRPVHGRYVGLGTVCHEGCGEPFKVWLTCNPELKNIMVADFGKIY